jgi:DNA-binding beta-propeller fold protein YncE
MATGNAVKMDMHITDTGLIKDGKRYKVTEVYTVVYDEETGKELQAVRWGEELKAEHARAKYTALSPEGAFAWGYNKSNGNLFFVDIKNNEVKPAPSFMQYAIGLNSRFALTNYNAMVMEVEDTQTNQAWRWRPLAYNRTLDPATVYNLSANQGNWFKEVE